MRVLLYTIVFFVSTSVVAQANNEFNTNTTVTNSTTPSAPIILEELEEVEMDTTINLKPEQLAPKSIQLQDVEKKESQSRKEKDYKSTEGLKIESVTEKEVRGQEIAVPAMDAPVKSTAVEREMQMRSYGFSSVNVESDMQRSSRSPSIQQQLQMNDAVNYFQTNAPGSFEYHYFKYVAGNYNVDLYPDLKVAEQIRPQNSDVHVQMAGYFIIEDDVDSALIYTDKLLESNRLQDNVVAYSEDLLRSVPENGALITHGFDDSYGSFHAQNSVGVRSDVTLISLDFLQSDAYKESLTSKGFKLPASKVVDVDYLADFCVLNADKNLSISLTTPKEYFQAIQDKLFVAGLVFEYHTESYNNFSRNDYLWNESLEKEIISSPGDEKGRQLSANYLPMLLHLRKVYSATGETEKLKEVDEVTDQVGVQCNKYEQLQKVKASY